METIPASTRWQDIVQGPSKEAVRAHIRKIANYTTLKSVEDGSPIMPKADGIDPVTSETHPDLAGIVENRRLAA